MALFVLFKARIAAVRRPFRVNVGREILVWSLASAKRRKKLAEDAERSRASVFRRRAAWFVVIVYNLVAIADIVSTNIAVGSGAGFEANPIMRLAMDQAGSGWVFAKLALQGVISFMVLWFPHWIVIGFFTLATVGNALIVHNNLVIAGVF
jgi:uncharacterized protein DUF5658